MFTLAVSFFVLVVGSLVGIFTLSSRWHRVGRLGLGASLGVLAFWFGVPLLAEVL